MPKEYVDSCHAQPFPEGQEAGEDHRFRIRIGWNREAGYVQIATLDRDYEMGGEHYQLGSDDARAGLFVDLDRRRINDLIRILRRARDQAFGRDE